MKNQWILCLILTVTSTAVVRAQENEAPLTPERVMQEAKLANTGVLNAAISKKVFSSQRLDLIRAYFHVAGESNRFLRDLEKIPDSDFRDEVYLMILEEPWRTDIPPGGFEPPGSRGVGSLRESCVNLIGPYMPEENLDANDPVTGDRFRTLAGRRVLAEKFRKALEAAKVTPPPAPAEVSQIPQPAPSSANEPTPAAAVKSAQAAAAAVDPKTKLYLIGAAIVAGLLALVGFLKQRQRKDSE